MYAFGISHADPEVMARNHDIVANAGGNAAVININSIGYGGFSFLRKRSRLVLHAHRNGWDILTRHPGLGLDFQVYQQFWRLLGVDQFQINGIGAKYWEPDESFVRSFRALQQPLFSQNDRPLPVAGSGQWGGQAPETFARTGRTQDLSVPLRRRRGQPSGWARFRRQGRSASVGGGGRGRSPGGLCARSSRTRAIHCQVRRSQERCVGASPAAGWKMNLDAAATARYAAALAPAVAGFDDAIEMFVLPPLHFAACGAAGVLILRRRHRRAEHALGNVGGLDRRDFGSDAGRSGLPIRRARSFGAPRTFRRDL